MAANQPLPVDSTRRSFLRKLKTFRHGLTPRQQRMLDAVVLASYWPDATSPPAGGRRLDSTEALYDELSPSASSWDAVLDRL